MLVLPTVETNTSTPLRHRMNRSERERTASPLLRTPETTCMALPTRHHIIHRLHPCLVLWPVFAAESQPNTLNPCSLKYMLDFGANPIERQLMLSAQFLHKELPVRLAHRVAELENLPYGLSAKGNILKVGNT